MDLPSGALVWERLLPGRTAPGLCLHPRLKVGPPCMQRDVQSLMVLVALELHHTQVAPSRLVLLGWKPSSDIL